MSTRIRLLTRGALIIVVLAALGLAAQLVLAQPPGPQIDINETASDGAWIDAPDVPVYNVIPIQGRLTDGNGTPIDGYRTITFTLYATSWDDIPLCQDDDSVQVRNGLFNAEMDWCDASDIDGKRLYLGIEVEGDDEMTPRESIYPVPYAFSLRPGAIISGSTSSAILQVDNYHSSGRSVRAYAMAEEGTNYAIVGGSRSPDGYGGYFYNNGGGRGLYGQTDAATNNYGIYTPDNFYSLNYHTTGATMQVVQNGGATALETGDVVVFSGMGEPIEKGGEPVILVAPATAANSPAVAGVVHSDYNIGGGGEADSAIQPGEYLLVVVRGPARVKADAVAGELAPGDLVATGGTDGSAARAAMVDLGGVGMAIPGTVLGKALEPLKDGQGLIHIYVTLQ